MTKSIVKKQKPSDLYAAYETNKDVELTGVWFPYAGGLSIKLARAGGANKEFTKLGERFQKKYKRRLDMGAIDNEETLAALIELYAKACVRDWEGAPDDAACTTDNVIKIFTDLPDLFNQVQQDAMEHEAYKEHIDKEAAKNSPSVSSTS